MNMIHAKSSVLLVTAAVCTVACGGRTSDAGEAILYPDGGPDAPVAVPAEGGSPVGRCRCEAREYFVIVQGDGAAQKYRYNYPALRQRCWTSVAQFAVDGCASDFAHPWVGPRVLACAAKDSFSSCIAIAGEGSLEGHYVDRFGRSWTLKDVNLQMNAIFTGKRPGTGYFAVTAVLGELKMSLWGTIDVCLPDRASCPM